MPTLDKELKEILKNISDKQLSQSTADYINFILYKVLKFLAENISTLPVKNWDPLDNTYILNFEKLLPCQLADEEEKYYNYVKDKKIKRIINSLKIKKIIKNQGFKYTNTIYPVEYEISCMSIIIQFIALKILKFGVDEANNRSRKRIERYYLIREIDNKDPELRDFIEDLFNNSLDGIADNVYSS